MRNWISECSSEKFVKYHINGMKIKGGAMKIAAMGVYITQKYIREFPIQPISHKYPEKSVSQNIIGLRRSVLLGSKA